MAKPAADAKGEWNSPSGCTERCAAEAPRSLLPTAHSLDDALATVCVLGSALDRRRIWNLGPAVASLEQLAAIQLPAFAVGGGEAPQPRLSIPSGAEAL